MLMASGRFIKYSILLILLFYFFCQSGPVFINPENNPVKNHSDSVLNVKFSKNGKIIASGGRDSDLFIWDGRSGKFVRQIRGSYDTIFDIEFLNADSQIITANYNGNILTWNLKTGKSGSVRLDSDFLSSLALAEDKNAYITSSWDNSIKIISTGDNKVIRECSDGDFKIRSLQYSKANGTIYAGTSNGKIIRWAFDTCDVAGDMEVQASTDAISSIDIDDNLGILVSGSVDKTLSVFELKTMKKIKELKGHKIQINSVKIIPGRNAVVSGDKDGKLYVWDLKSGQFRVFAAHVASINTIDVSPDNHYLVTGGSDYQVKVWKVKKFFPKK